MINSSCLLFMLILLVLLCFFCRFTCSFSMLRSKFIKGLKSVEIFTVYTFYIYRVWFQFYRGFSTIPCIQSIPGFRQKIHIFQSYLKGRYKSPLIHTKKVSRGNTSQQRYAAQKILARLITIHSVTTQYKHLNVAPMRRAKENKEYDDK